MYAISKETLRVGSTESVEGRRQVRRDRLGAPALDLVPLEHEGHLPVLQDGDRRRRGSVARKIGTRPGRRFHVLARENGHHVVRPNRVLDGQGHGRPGVLGVYY